MSKTITKVIATLGVVAGLGVAALPLTSYAAHSEVDVYIEVEGLLTVAAAATDLDLGQTDASVAAVPQTTIVTVTDNSGGTHDIVMGVDNAAASAALIHTSTPTNLIPASATNVIAGTAGWQYAHDGSGTLTWSIPTQYTDSLNTTGGTPIASNAAATGGTADYTIGARATVSGTTPVGIYKNTIVIYAIEH